MTISKKTLAVAAAMGLIGAAGEALGGTPSPKAVSPLEAAITREKDRKRKPKRHSIDVDGDRNPEGRAPTRRRQQIAKGQLGVENGLWRAP